MILPWSEKLFDWEGRCRLARKQDDKRKKKTPTSLFRKVGISSYNHSKFLSATKAPF